MDEKESNETKEQETKKPYEKPQIVYRAPLEAMADVCAPLPATCTGSGKSGAGCENLYS